MEKAGTTANWQAKGVVNNPVLPPQTLRMSGPLLKLNRNVNRELLSTPHQQAAELLSSWEQVLAQHAWVCVFLHPKYYRHTRSFYCIVLGNRSQKPQLQMSNFNGFTFLPCEGLFWFRFPQILALSISYECDEKQKFQAHGASWWRNNTTTLLRPSYHTLQISQKKQNYTHTHTLKIWGSSFL